MYSDRHLWQGDLFDIQTTGDKAHFAPLVRVAVHAIGVVPLGTDAGGATIKVDKALVGARGDGDVGILTIPAANKQFVCQYEEVATPVILEPGDVAVFEVTAEGVSALNAIPQIEYSIAEQKRGDATNADAV
jgi:hypothetical protein